MDIETDERVVTYNESWMKLISLTFLDSGDAGGVAVFGFGNTEDVRTAVTVHMPIEEATPVRLEQLYNEVNLKYPEAHEHRSDLVLHIARLSDAQT